MLIRGLAVTPSQPRALPYRDGAWYGPDGQSITNQALAVDTVYCTPLFLEFTTPVRRIAANVGTAVLSSFMRIAFYGNRTDGAIGPGAALITSMTEYDMNQVADTALELDFGTALVLPRGFYWALARGGGTAQPQPRTFGPAATTNAEIQRLFGQASARAVFAGATNTTSTVRLTFALPYADAWPASAPIGTFGTNAPGSVQFAWRRD